MTHNTLIGAYFEAKGKSNENPFILCAQFLIVWRVPKILTGLKMNYPVLLGTQSLPQQF